MVTPITIRSKTATAAHTEPIMMAKLPEFFCEESRGADKLGLGWSDAVELRQDGSGTSSLDPSILVQAEGMGVMKS